MVGTLAQVSSKTKKNKKKNHRYFALGQHIWETYPTGNMLSPCAFRLPCSLPRS